MDFAIRRQPPPTPPTRNGTNFQTFFYFTFLFFYPTTIINHHHHHHNLPVLFPATITSPPTPFNHTIFALFFFFAYLNFNWVCKAQFFCLIFSYLAFFLSFDNSERDYFYQLTINPFAKAGLV